MAPTVPLGRGRAYRSPPAPLATPCATVRALEELKQELALLRAQSVPLWCRGAGHSLPTPSAAPCAGGRLSEGETLRAVFCEPPGLEKSPPADKSLLQTERFDLTVGDEEDDEQEFFPSPMADGGWQPSSSEPGLLEDECAPPLDGPGANEFLVWGHETAEHPVHEEPLRALSAEEQREEDVEGVLHKEGVWVKQQQTLSEEELQKTDVEVLYEEDEAPKVEEQVLNEELRRENGVKAELWKVEEELNVEERHAEDMNVGQLGAVSAKELKVEGVERKLFDKGLERVAVDEEKRRAEKRHEQNGNDELFEALSEEKPHVEVMPQKLNKVAPSAGQEPRPEHTMSVFAGLNKNKRLARKRGLPVRALLAAGCSGAEAAQGAAATECWRYISVNGAVFGPFESSRMRQWHLQGHFSGDLLVSKGDQEAFSELSNYFPIRSQAFTVCSVYASRPSEVLLMDGTKRLRADKGLEVAMRFYKQVKDALRQESVLDVVNLADSLSEGAPTCKSQNLVSLAVTVRKVLRTIGMEEQIAHDWADSHDAR